jgi:hypothetical protein
MPFFIMFSKSEPRQGAEGSRCLCESEFRLDSDFGLGIFTMSERDQAGSLRLGEDKVSSPRHTKGAPTDSVCNSMR